mgnify:CR=1 FL=1
MGAASLATLWGEFLCVQLQGQVRVAVAALLALAFFWHAGISHAGTGAHQYQPLVGREQAVSGRSGRMYLTERRRQQHNMQIIIYSSRKAEQWKFYRSEG